MRGHRAAAVCATVAAVVVAFFFAPGQAGAVVGGTLAEPGEFPFAAAPVPVDCSASLIAPTWVITAAHCATRTPQLRIGSTDQTTGGELINVKRNIPHPDYKPSGEGVAVNDLRLIELEHAATSTPVSVIGPDEPSLEAPGMNATVIGYGEPCSPFDPDNPVCLDRDALRSATMPIISTAECAAAPHEFYSTVDGTKMLCTLLPGGGKSPCFRDSGGPLVVVDNGRMVLVGTVDGGEEPCGRPDGPAVYTRVSAFLPWISDVTGIDFDAPTIPTTTTTTTSTSTSTTTSTAPTSTPLPAAAVAVTPNFAG